MTKNEIIKNWVTEYSEPLLKRGKYLISNLEEAEDLVQETFIVAHNSYESFQGKSKPLTWLMAILNNKVSDYYRKKYKHETSINIDSYFDESGSWKNKNVVNKWNISENNTQLLDDNEFNKTMENCIESLPEKWRLLVKLYYLEEKKTAEVSQELEISTTNIWKVLQRSRLQLRECLEMNWFSKI